MGEWQVTTFGNLLAEPVRNGIYKKKEFHGSGAKIVNMGELFATPRLRSVPMKRVELSDMEAERFNLMEGDLLFARRSLVAEGAGKCSIVLEIEELTTFESSIIRARPNTTRADPLFLYYFFNSPQGFHKLDTIRRQVAVAGITGSDLAKLEFPVPNLHTQGVIASLLSALDDKIELNRETNKTLDALARTFFKDWFVDFGPTRAKAEGRVPYLASEIWDLFPDALDDEDKPVGWEIRPLDQIARFLNGLALQKYPPNGDDYLPVIKIAELRAGVTDKSGKSSTDIPSDYVVVDGDVLFSWSGSLTQIVWTGGRGALNQHLFKVTSDDFPKWFFFHWVNQHLPAFQAIAASKATTMGHIQRRHLTEAATIVPGGMVLKAADGCIAPLFQRCLVNSLENQTLAQTRDLLLPKLMSGEIRLREAEKLVEAVV